MVDIAQLQERLTGRALPGGVVTVPSYERWISHDAWCSPPLEQNVLHPAWVFIAGLQGMGMPLAELLALAEADLQAGVMWGEVVLEQHEVLRDDVEYRVTGRITDVRRQAGKKAGVFDVMTFRLEVLCPDGRLAGASTSSFIFVRRGQ